MAPIASAGGAAGYFTADNYYTEKESSELSEWGGEGAKEQGLEGSVEGKDFEKLLEGKLPDGTDLKRNENRRHGTDLTFSMPKSASIMGYVAGDKRIMAEHVKAVKDTLSYVEKNLSQKFTKVDGKTTTEKTGNLVYALFQHNTSRALDPQGHIHAVIANATKDKDGRWRALDNSPLWSNNTLIGSIYHANFRDRLEKLGYQTEAKGKHANFEITNVPQKLMEQFSQRRTQILETVEKLGIKSPEGRDLVTKLTRDKKLNVGDHKALEAVWKQTAEKLGYNLSDVKNEAIDRSSQPATENESVLTMFRNGLDKLKEMGVERKYADNILSMLGKNGDEVRTQMAVGSAIVNLSEKEAAFDRSEIIKGSLGFALKGVTLEKVEQRIGKLAEKGHLIEGVKSNEFTTKESVALETKIVSGMRQGQGATKPLMNAEKAESRLKAASEIDFDKQQMESAKSILSSKDRTIAIQGNAGAGKSKMLEAVATILRTEGKDARGLAFQNKMVGDLREGTGLESQTVASLLFKYENIFSSGSNQRVANATREAKGAYWILDEASMVSNKQMDKLIGFANRLEINKLVLVGDKGQLPSIDAGKSFSLLQASNTQTYEMTVNWRQQTSQLRELATLASQGKTDKALNAIDDKIVVDKDVVGTAVNLWMKEKPENRETTALFSSGRLNRNTLNEKVQAELIKEGSLSKEFLKLKIHDRTDTSKEELKYASKYEVGGKLVVSNDQIGLARGEYDILKSSDKSVTLKNERGKTKLLRPRQLSEKQRNNMAIVKDRELKIHEGDKIKWTANDKKRGLNNSDLAKILKIQGKNVVVETKNNKQLTLKQNDPMLKKLDLAYALNMHMAQGITAEKGIVVMSANESKLNNQRLFYVGVTRSKSDIKVVMDDKDKISRTLRINTGDKTSSLQSTGKVDIADKMGPSRDIGPTSSPTTSKEPKPAPSKSRVPEKKIELGL